MNFIDDARRAKMPAQYCQIFSEHIFKVVEDLKNQGIADFEPIAFLYRENCIFVLIPAGTRYKFSIGNVKISGVYSEASSNNLNINGFDYETGMTEFYLNTEIGYRNNWYNINLFPKLLKLEQNNAPSAVSKHHTNCTFKRKICCNKIQKNVYAEVASYNKLIDYLKVVMASGVYHNPVTGAECKQKFQSLGYPIDAYIDSLKDWVKYNWLEYLKITTPPIDIELFLAEDSAAMKNFEQQIYQHFIGMFLLDYIWQH